jgi:p-methyltransferase
MRVTPKNSPDVLVLHDRPFDDREAFKARVVESIHRFLRRAPSFDIRNRQEDRSWDLGADANLSLVSVVLATGMEEIGASYKVWDADNLLMVAGQRVAEDLRNDPGIIAVSSSHFTTESQFGDFIRFVRGHNPEAILIVGGQLLDICPDIEEHVPQVDYYVHGDGEVVFPRLVRAILDRGGRASVDLPGVRYRENGTFKGGKNWELLDINDVPLPRWDLVLKRDFNDGAPRRSRFLPMVFVEEVRGCMHRCAFCAYPRNIPYRMKSPDRILHELQQCVQWGLKHFNFYSALFTSPPKHCREILEGIIQQGLDITFSCQARADDLYRAPEMVDLMRRAGCVHISMGIESGDPELLKRMRKPLEIPRVVKIVERIHEAGISLCGNFFIGFPGETQASIEATDALLRRCNFTTLYLSAFVVEKAAEVFRNRGHYGLEVSEDGRTWRHPTMDSDGAEEETERLFIRLARDVRLRTVLWVIQWRFARYFPRLVSDGDRPELWDVLRLMQEGVANELEFTRDGGSETEHDRRQKAIWERVMSCQTLFEEG